MVLICTIIKIWIPDMATIPKKVRDRLIQGLKTFRPVLENAKVRDVNEADTVTIVKDMLADVFGYDKYSEVTSEYSIRGTYCDLATKIDGKIQTLIEVKAIGLDLNDKHVKQAVDYAANQGVDWVLLTNGVSWRVYHVRFSKPIEHELVIDLNFTQLDTRNNQDIDHLFLWCKEGFAKSVLGEYHDQRQALNRFFVGAVIMTDPVLEVIRRELRRISPDVKIDVDQLRPVVRDEVLKRDVVEGEKALEAQKALVKASSKALRKAKLKEAKTPLDGTITTTEQTDVTATPSGSVTIQEVE